jgi:outer membrane protein assembly factor BamB
MKIITAIIFTLNLFILLLSCNQPKKKLPLQSSESKLPKLVWKTLTTEGKAMMEGLIPLHIYKNGIVCNGQTHTMDRERLLMFNIQDGSILWEWKDIRQRQERLFIILPMTNIGNILLMRNGNKIHAINLDSGTTVWDKRCADGSNINTLDTTFFFAASDNFIWRGNVHSGHIDTIFSLKNTINFSNMETDLSEPRLLYPIIEKNKDTSIIVTYYTGNSKINQFDAWFLKYNINKRKVIYNQNILPRTITMSGVFKIELFEDKVYFSAGRSIVCHNLKTGKQQWKKDFQGGLINSGMIIRDRKIFLHADEFSSQDYALDPFTGKEIWKVESRGTMHGELFYMKGVIYYVNAGDGLLHALDANTGKHLWKIESPSEKENSNDYFYGSVTGISNKIFVRSGFHLYCYQVSP